MKAFLLQFFTWWNKQTLGTRFYTWRNGTPVGKDAFGNSYFQGKKDSQGYSRRWVIYHEISDPSSIPSGWHAWIHHRTDILPTSENYAAPLWAKPHQPNQTGTSLAYRPKGSINSHGNRPKVGGDYEPWIPK